MVVRILIEIALVLALLWVWSLYYERSFDQADPPSREKSD